MTTRDPRNTEQENVNGGRRRKTYKIREENKRDDLEQDRTTVLSDDQRRLEKEKSENHREKSFEEQGIQFK